MTTRPATARIRESIFSRLLVRLDFRDLAVLDIFAGSGSLGIEALSRGAERATMVDRDTRPALGNVERLGLAARVELVRAEAGGWLAGAAGAAGHSYDIVFVDAPYKLADLVAEELDTHLPRVLAPGGRAVVESGARRPLALRSLERLRQRRYGAADVSIYAAASS
jgi:16S rRNA (guanine966-N2)-methyltransferase